MKPLLIKYNSKYSLLFITTLAVIFVLAFNKSVFGQNSGVILCVYNKTGFDVDSISSMTKYIGSIKKDSSIAITYSHGLPMTQSPDRSLIPLGDPRGIINGEKFLKLNSFCGKEYNMVSNGNYNVDIVYIETELLKRKILSWAPHKNN